MATALVRDLDDAVYERLKARAAGNNRSCHRALQNQPLVGASKPATILTGFGHVG